jgi:hypothetical protein
MEEDKPFTPKFISAFETIETYKNMNYEKLNKCIFLFWKQLFYSAIRPHFDHLCEMITYFEPGKPEEYETDEEADALEAYNKANEEEIEAKILADSANYCWHSYARIRRYSFHDQIYPKDKFHTHCDVYHNIEPIINKYIDSLSVDYIIERIRSFFHDDENLRDFENVKNKLIDMVTEKYRFLVRTKRDQIISDLKQGIAANISYVGFIDQLDDTPLRITSLYQLHILYPLSQMKISFSHDDYYKTRVC